MKSHRTVRKPLGRAEMFDTVADQLRAPFRGEIWEFFSGTPMGRGFANEGQPFDIETANYLREPIREIRVRPFGKFVFLAAVQMMKTHATIEQPAGFFICNDPGDMTIYFSGDESALDQSKARFKPFLSGNPEIAKIMAATRAAGPEGRYAITTDEFYLPGMVLRIWPLNESSTQRITLRYVFISDAFLSKRTGLIQQAIARTTQHDTVRIRDYKIVLESQGSEEDDDFDKQWQSTDQRRLHVVCPECASRQIFDWHRLRPEDFVPIPPKDIPSLDHQEWIAHHRPLLLKEERRHAGMKRGDDVRREDGGYDETAVLRQTYYECYHCGRPWRDDSKTRLALDRSSTYVRTNETAPSHDIGFWWPAWAGQRIAWGKIMLEYLDAKCSAANANYDPLKLWHQKRAARPWSLQITRPQIEVSAGSYDPNQLIENEFARNMYVDCQQDQELYDRTGTSLTGWFWYVVRVVDKLGNSRQLARGFAKSWEHWIAVKNQWKVPNDRVHIDINHWPEQIMLKAASEAETVKVEKPIPPFFLRERMATWILMSGTAETRFRHRDGRYRAWSEPQIIPITVFDKEGRKKIIPLKKVRVCNLAFSIQLDAIRRNAPGMPKFEVLDRSRLDPLSQEMETGNRAYEKQMDAEFLTQKNGKDKYEAVHPDSHYRDCERGLLVRQAIDGMLGHLPVSATERE